jgi:hypothetical protein
VGQNDELDQAEFHDHEQKVISVGASRPQGASKGSPASLRFGGMADLLFDAVERAQLSDLFDELRHRPRRPRRGET